VVRAVSGLEKLALIVVSWFARLNLGPTWDLSPGVWGCDY
jgi:hypothetical protein